MDRFLYWLGNLLVYGPLRNVLGMSRVRVAYTAGEAIGPDLFRFYRSIGINLKQLYGSTETCAFVCLQPDGAGEARQRRPGRCRASSCRFTPERRAARSAGPVLLKEYYKQPDATARSDRRGRLFPYRRRGLLRRRTAT